jgi:hypothetical protein
MAQEPIDLLQRATAGRGLRLRGEAETLRRFRRKLMYERQKDSTFSGLVFRLRGDELQILNSGQVLGELEDTLW